MWVFTLVIFTNCNNSGDSKKTVDTTTAKVDTPQVSNQIPKTDTVPLKFVDGSVFYTVRITPDDFKNIFESNSGSNDVKQVYFEHRSVGGGYALKATGALGEGSNTTDTYDLQVVQGGNTIPYQSTIYVAGGQQLTRGEVKYFFKKATESNREAGIYLDQPIDGKRFTSEVWLTPCVYDDTLVYMATFPADPAPACGRKKKTRKSFVVIYTNPSPPARPCDNACDDPLYKKR
jgi:hypothetical protein